MGLPNIYGRDCPLTFTYRALLIRLTMGKDVRRISLIDDEQSMDQLLTRGHPVTPVQIHTSIAPNIL